MITAVKRKKGRGAREEGRGSKPNPKSQIPNSKSQPERLTVVSTGAVTAIVELRYDVQGGVKPWSADFELAGPGFRTDMAPDGWDRFPDRTKALLSTLKQLRFELNAQRHEGHGHVARASATRAVKELEQYRRIVESQEPSVDGPGKKRLVDMTDAELAEACKASKTPEHLIGELSGCLANVNGKTRGEGRGARGEDSDDRFEHESFGCIPAAEKWLKKHHVPKQAWSIYLAVMPRRGKKISIALSDWAQMVNAVVTRWIKAGWHSAKLGCKWQLEGALDGAAVGIEIDPDFINVHALKKDDPEFCSETGYRSFTVDDGAKTTPQQLLREFAAARKEYREELARDERRAAREAKRAAKTQSKIPNPKSPIPSPSSLAPRPSPAIPAETAFLDPLKAGEKRTLAKLEAAIERNLAGFVEVGRALAEIRDSRLYRETHETFEAYCRDRWQLSRSQAYRQIAAAEVFQQVSPIGDKLGAVPAIESQARPLAKIDADQRAEVWEAVVKAAPKVDGKPRITAELVESQVREWNRTFDSPSSLVPTPHAAACFRLAIRARNTRTSSSRSWRGSLSALRRIRANAVRTRRIRGGRMASTAARTWAAFSFSAAIRAHNAIAASWH